MHFIKKKQSKQTHKFSHKMWSTEINSLHIYIFLLTKINAERKKLNICLCWSYGEYVNLQRKKKKIIIICAVNLHFCNAIVAGLFVSHNNIGEETPRHMDVPWETQCRHVNFMMISFYYFKILKSISWIVFSISVNC